VHGAFTCLTLLRVNFFVNVYVAAVNQMRFIHKQTLQLLNVIIKQCLQQIHAAWKILQLQGKQSSLNGSVVFDFFFCAGELISNLGHLHHYFFNYLDDAVIKNDL